MDSLWVRNLKMNDMQSVQSRGRDFSSGISKIFSGSPHFSRRSESHRAFESPRAPARAGSFLDLRSITSEGPRDMWGDLSAWDLRRAEHMRHKGHLHGFSHLSTAVV